MPQLKHVLANARLEQYRSLRAKAMECVSLIGLAVGKEMVRHSHCTFAFIHSIVHLLNRTFIRSSVHSLNRSVTHSLITNLTYLDICVASVYA